MSSILPQIDLNNVVTQVVAILLATALLSILGYLISQKFRDFPKNLPSQMAWLIKWLVKQWRYVVLLFLTILLEIAIYKLYVDWRIIVFSIAHFALIAFAVWFLTFKRTPPKALFTYDFRSALDVWTVTTNDWSPRTGGRGLELVPYDNLSKILVLDELPQFVDGVIECEVYLESGAIFDVMLRGDLNIKEFYMARLDTRQRRNDCILFKPRERRWAECNDRETLKYHSPPRRWLKMRIVADKHTISLYRNGQKVDEINNAITTIGKIGLFAELANVYVKKISICPY